MKRNKVAVIGLGNRLMTDEGTGLHAVDLLRKRTAGQDLAADLVEAGTPGMGLLHQFENREKIIFIDAGYCDQEPGQFRKFHYGAVVSRKELKGHSLHEFDLIAFLEFAEKLGKLATVDVVIYCMQAADIAMGENLSPVVEKNLPFLIKDVYNEIKGNQDA